MRFAIRVLVLALVVAVPILVARWQVSHQRNFRVVEPGVLYRSGQMDLVGLRFALHDHGIRTVVSLRDSGEGSAYLVQREEELCRKLGVDFVSLPVMPWYAREGESEPAAMANVRQLLGLLRERRHHPVLIHCFAGIHRTGIYCAVVRMERDGWDLDRVLEEMRSCGYDEIDEHDDVMGFLRGYRAGTWKAP